MNQKMDKADNDDKFIKIHRSIDNIRWDLTDLKSSDFRVSQ